MTNTYVKPDSPLCELSADETCRVVSHDPVCCNRMQRAFTDPPSKEITLQAKTFTYSPGLGRQGGTNEWEFFFSDYPSVSRRFNSVHPLLCYFHDNTCSLLPAVTRAWLHFAPPPHIIKRKKASQYNSTNTLWHYHVKSHPSSPSPSDISRCWILDAQVLSHCEYYSLYYYW